MKANIKYRIPIVGTTLTVADKVNINTYLDEIADGVFSHSTASGTYTLSISDTFIAVDGNTTIVLPTATGDEGRKFTIKKKDSGTTLKVTGTGGQTIDGTATFGLTTIYSSVTVVNDGTNWWVI